MLQHVLILGSGRSGTSIFGELFEHLPCYMYLSEPGFDDLLDTPHDSPLAVKVPRRSERYPCTPGLSFPLEMLPRVFRPTLKIFWIVRHPLDVIASLRVGIARNWGHHPRPPDWKGWLRRPLVERCAHHWAHINTVGYERVRDVAEVRRFESMVRNPRDFARAAWSAVGGDGMDATAAIREWSVRVQDTDNEHFVEALTSRSYSRPDHTVRIGRWRENLSVDDVKAVLPLVEETASEFGYALAHDPAPAGRAWPRRPGPGSA